MFCATHFFRDNPALRRWGGHGVPPHVLRNSFFRDNPALRRWGGHVPPLQLRHLHSEPLTKKCEPDDRRVFFSKAISNNRNLFLREVQIPQFEFWSCAASWLQRVMSWPFEHMGQQARSLHQPNCGSFELSSRSSEFLKRESITRMNQVAG